MNIKEIKAIINLIKDINDIFPGIKNKIPIINKERLKISKTYSISPSDIVNLYIEIKNTGNVNVYIKQFGFAYSNPSVPYIIKNLNKSLYKMKDVIISEKYKKNLISNYTNIKIETGDSAIIEYNIKTNDIMHEQLGENLEDKINNLTFIVETLSGNVYYSN